MSKLQVTTGQDQYVLYKADGESVYRCTETSDSMRDKMVGMMLMGRIASNLQVGVRMVIGGVVTGVVQDIQNIGDRV